MQPEPLSQGLLSEILTNERLRSNILLGFIGAVFIYLLTIFAFLSEVYQPVNDGSLVLGWLIVFMIFIAVRTLIVKKLLVRWLMISEIAYKIARYVNIFFETSLPSLAILLFAVNVNNVFALLSPLVFLYFIFIILSTLELDFKISVFTGVIAAVEYFLLVLYFIDSPFDVPAELSFANNPFVFLGKSVILLLSGIVAGFVSEQFKKGTRNKLKVLEERKYIENLFGQQVSHKIVNELLETRREILSRRRQVCIMFLDIRRFTQFCEGKSPEEIVQYQNDVFSFMIEIINKYDGLINQFMGDGFMATFGAPITHDRDSQNAVMAALQIIEEVKQFSEKNNGPNTQVGIGLDFGEVVTGNVGTPLRKQYSITGNPVISAARLEQLNKQFKSNLLVSAEVLERVKLPEGQPVDDLGTVPIKGRSHPIHVFRLA